MPEPPNRACSISMNEFGFPKNTFLFFFLIVGIKKALKCLVLFHFHWCQNCKQFFGNHCEFGVSVCGVHVYVCVCACTYMHTCMDMSAYIYMSELKQKASCARLSMATMCLRITPAAGMCRKRWSITHQTNLTTVTVLFPGAQRLPLGTWLIHCEHLYCTQRHGS